MNKNKKNQAIAVTVAASLLVGGTLAWQSFSQTALNESAGIDGDVGARLHNDFNGSNADVYVENYASENGTTVYTRVRLHEYMEVGEGAGTLNNTASTLPTVVRGDLAVGSGTPDLDYPLTWDIHMFGQDGYTSAGSEISEYVSVNYGDYDNANLGRKAYMPTFNKDMDSTLADIKGELLGTLANDGDYGNRREDEFSDDAVLASTYVEYTVGETLEGTATYSSFSEVAAQNDGETEIEETHSAKYTHTAYAPISMKDWQESGEIIGNYWIYDTDGWVYWANGIAPQSATGLLVDSVTVNKDADEDYHYGIHVEMQAFSAEDWTENIEVGSELSDDAIALFNKAAGLVSIEDIEVGSRDTIRVDGQDFYVVAIDTVMTYEEDGTELEEVEAALLWTSTHISLDGDIMTAGNNIGTSYHDQETGLTGWSDSHIKTAVLPAWMETMPNLSSMALRTKLETTGYHTPVEDILSGIPDGNMTTETTYEDAFIFSAEEIVIDYPIQSEFKFPNDESSYWIRSAKSETHQLVIRAMTSEIAGNYGHMLATIARVRPAVWVELSKLK